MAPTLQTEPLPLGPVLDATGATFAVYSATARSIELCVRAPTGGERRLALDRGADDVWRGRLAGARPGARYGFRAHGPRPPRAGLSFDPGRLLLDPYARAVDGEWSVLVDEAFDWGDDRAPATTWGRTVVYEAHVRGLTRLHPAIAPALRGTFRGLASAPVLDELVALGVTAVELLPVHHFVPEPEVVARGLTNYWGYSTIGFFAPHAPYAVSRGGGEVAEFKEMVRALHAAGLEVILDVVYNHTAEGGPNGPTMCFRGLDNPAYYRLDPHDPARYRDVTGCGNTLDARSPVARRLVLDSLRYWVEEMHVDGFRFDLASALGRVDGDFEPAAPLIQEIATDPVLAGVKLIAEAWDAAPGGYAVGRFPPPWADWNGIFRDTVRDFWRGRAPTSDLARALAGSSDAYAPSGRGPLASVNYVACHDGMPLRDLVSYDHKWNLANGEGNRDGDDHNRSWNSGVEGPTDDVAVRELRRRRAAAMLATVFCSAGVPMIGQGDERWRTQQGNNNAYCHDSPLTWLSWADDPETTAMHDLVARLVRLRAEHPALRREGWFRGDRGDGSPVDVRWLTPGGDAMDDTWWQAAEARVLGALYAGAATPGGGPDVLVVANAAGSSVWFDLPAGAWARLVDSSRPGGVPEEGTATEAVDVPAWAVLVLRRA